MGPNRHIFQQRFYLNIERNANKFYWYFLLIIISLQRFYIIQYEFYIKNKEDLFWFMKDWIQIIINLLENVVFIWLLYFIADLSIEVFTLVLLLLLVKGFFLEYNDYNENYWQSSLRSSSKSYWGFKSFITLISDISENIVFPLFSICQNKYYIELSNSVCSKT